MQRESYFSTARIERLLFQLPIFIAASAGAIYMVARFVSVLRENLKESPGSWGAVLLLAVLIGGVAAIVILACAAVGAAAGVILRACFARHSRAVRRGALQ